MAQTGRKPRKTMKNWLTTANANPEIRSVPQNASAYRFHPYTPSKQPSSSQTEPHQTIFNAQNSHNTFNAVQNSRNSDTLTELTFAVQIPPSPLPLPDPSNLLVPDMPKTLSTLFKDIQNIPPAPPPRKKRKLSPDEYLTEKLSLVDKHLQRICADFGSVGDFLSYLFWSCPKKRDKDLRLSFHRNSISRFLQGRNKVKAVDIVNRIFHHRSSYPTYRYQDERSKSYSLTEDPTSLSFARVAISSWIAQISAARAHRDITTLLKDDTDHPEDAPARLPSNSVTWQDINSWSPERVIKTFQQRTPFLYGFFKYLSLPRKGGEPVEQLHRTILSNYLVKFGLRYKERDLMQEDHNGKIEVMAPKAGGEFNGSYFHEIITPNIHHLIDIGRNFESGFGLSHRKTTHTSPNMRPEIRALLSSIESSELHLFRAHHSYEGHIATDLFSKGYEGLGSGGKLDEFKRKTATRAKFIAAIENEKQRVLNTQNENDTAPSDTRMSDTSPSLNLSANNDSDAESESEQTDSTESSSEEGSDHAESGSEIEVERMQDDGPEDEESEEDEIMEERSPDSSEDEENWCTNKFEVGPELRTPTSN
ncbi:hypothetical protein K435DRAFT_863792 [Dendrothele bispora CBS 962.96]|uniref:DUF6589 domain-containing protein n=1 Tax=Dendrothele bispora (strain CBS 962.96) TaxID=1314807 RepID=A0A4S8LQ95_DENBC|nr:hypothetical protein K435DRAFT_863792 [Dendrothele bispora CBS 962.96]